MVDAARMAEPVGKQNVTASRSVGYLSMNLQREALRPPMRAFVAF
jgi:hypothetical protein